MSRPLAATTPTKAVITAAMQARQLGYCSFCGVYLARSASGPFAGAIVGHHHPDPWVLLRAPGDWTDGPEPEPLAPLAELAEQAGVARQTAWRWLEAGELGEGRHVGPDRRVTYVAVALFMKALKSKRRRHRSPGSRKENGHAPA